MYKFFEKKNKQTKNPIKVNKKIKIIFCKIFAIFLIFLYFYLNRGNRFQILQEASFFFTRSLLLFLCLGLVCAYVSIFLCLILSKNYKLNIKNMHPGQSIPIYI